MMKRAGLLVLVVAGVAAALSGAGQSAWAQGYGGDDRPPPPRFDRPPPPPDEDYGYRRPPPPPPRYADEDDGPPLMCRTPEGSCPGHGPRFYRARCFCDFGDGPVHGRMR